LQSNSFPHARLGEDDMAASAMALLEALVFKQPDQIIEVDVAI